MSTCSLASSNSPNRKAYSSGAKSIYLKPSTSKFRKHSSPSPNQDNALSSLISYSYKIDEEKQKAFVKKQSETQSYLQTKLDNLVQADTKDYFQIAQTLFEIVVNKEQDIVTRLGPRKAERLQSALSNQGVDQIISQVIQKTDEMKDPAEMLKSELDGKMGEEFDIDALRRAWRKASNTLLGEVKIEKEEGTEESMKDIDPKLLAQAIALKKGDISTYEKLEDNDQEYLDIVDALIQEEEPQRTNEETVVKEEIDLSVYGQFWEDYPKIDSEITQFQKEDFSHLFKPTESKLTCGPDSGLSRGRSKSPHKLRLMSSQQEGSTGSIGRDQSSLVMRRERDAFFSHLDKIRKAHKLQLNHIKIIAKDKAKDVIRSKLEGVKKVFADEMAGMIEQFEGMSTALQKKEEEINKVKGIIFSQEKIIAELNVFINSRFYQEMRDITTAKQDIMDLAKGQEQITFNGQVLRKGEDRPIVMNDAFQFYNHYFNLSYHDQQNMLKRKLIDKHRQQYEKQKQECTMVKEENKMLHSVIQMLKQSEKGHQELITEQEETIEKMKQEHQRTIEMYEHKMKNHLDDYMREKKGMNQGFDKYKEVVKEELRVNELIRKQQEERIQEYMKELKQVKTVLKYPRLHHKFIETLEYQRIESYKEGMAKDKEEQRRLQEEARNRLLITRTPGRKLHSFGNERLSASPGDIEKLSRSAGLSKTMVMNRKTKAMIGKNKITRLSVAPDSFSPISLHGKLSSSFQSKEFDSTAPPSQLSYIPLAQRWATQRVSQSSSRNASAKKGFKNRDIPSDMINIGQPAFSEFSGRNTHIGVESATTLESRRTISLSPQKRNHRKGQYSSPSGKLDRTSNATLATLNQAIPIQIQSTKISSSDLHSSASKRPDFFDTSGKRFSLKTNLRQTYMSQFSGVPESKGESDK